MCQDGYVPSLLCAKLSHNRLKQPEIKISKHLQIKTQYVYVCRPQTDTETKILSTHVYNGLDTGLYFICMCKGNSWVHYICTVNVHCLELFEWPSR